jgi:hypothetical protein
MKTNQLCSSNLMLRTSCADAIAPGLAPLADFAAVALHALICSTVVWDVWALEVWN